MRRLIIPFFVIKFCGKTSSTENTPMDSKKINEETIPFIIEKQHTPQLPQKKDLTSQTMGRYKSLEADFKTRDSQGTIANEIMYIPVASLKNLIKTFKGDVCSVNHGGAFELTFKVDAGGKILGIGVSGEGGLKVTITCDKP